MGKQWRIRDCDLPPTAVPSMKRKSENRDSILWSQVQVLDALPEHSGAARREGRADKVGFATLQSMGLMKLEAVEQAKGQTGEGA